MKIANVICQVLRLPQVAARADSSQDAAIIRIRTDDGLEGIGEAVAQPDVIKAIVDAPMSHSIACGLRELLLGENPLDTRRLWETMGRRTMYLGRRGVAIAAMAGIDMALWDLKGKYLNQPIHQLLGGKQHDRIKAYASTLFGRDGAATAEIGRRWIEEGYQAVKFGWEPMGRSEALDLELVRGARQGVGEAELLIDAGCVYDRRTALRRAGQYADFNIGWLEEPLGQDDLAGYRWLRDRSPVPIAAGEGECGWAAFKPWIDRQALDIYQVDLARNGFTDAVAIGQRVQENAARLVNHFYSTAITAAASLHWLCIYRDTFLFEDCVELSPLRRELTEQPVMASKGWIAVPDGPGLGITLDESLVRRYLVAESGR
jgi:L-alanine-DL-glutamate epimerase-like enolase superfamily enzyme